MLSRIGASIEPCGTPFLSLLTLLLWPLLVLLYFSPVWKLSSMSCHRRVTWSVIDLPLRKPACSLSRWGLNTGSRRARIRRSRSLYGTQSNEMGRYPFGLSLGLLAFLPRCLVYSRWILSTPGALPCAICQLWIGGAVPSCRVESERLLRIS